jgi:nicotinate-nucleotide pyrophosphorylase (carboxylating)
VESDIALLRSALKAFLAEDIGRGDATSRSVVPEGTRAKGFFLAKSELVVSGLSVAREVFRLLESDLEWVSLAQDGILFESGRKLAELAGDAKSLLSAERVALNLLQRMSGIATETRRYVEAVRGTGCSILDTRKTAPGLRVFDKRAVVDGGGRNHRFGLDDGILIKDNHIALSGGIPAAVGAARAGAPFGLKIEVEVENESQLREAVEAGADLVLLDNRTPTEATRLISICRSVAPKVSIEASGGITLANVRAYAEAGADFVSVGALTHSVRASDVSLELEVA